LHPGIYCAFTGPPPRMATLWAALLAAGPGAVLSHESAAELAGLLDGPAPAVHVTVPFGRKVVAMPGVVVHRSRRVDSARHPSRELPQTRIEETVIDLTQAAAGIEDAYGWMARAVNAGLTTPHRLLSALQRRTRVRWRRLLREGLGDVRAGCRSVLELAYLREVEQAHGLPRGRRQVRVTRGGRRNYLDVRYDEQRISVELDGEAAHPYHRRFSDRRRDNAATLAGDVVLRYGTADVRGRPCDVAAQVARVLYGRGWSGEPHGCADPECPLDRGR
jgi:hypothetical protein